jgi:lipopolysaccharide biosynthesis regulator YciM
MPASDSEAAPVVAVATAAPVATPARNIIYQGELDLAVTDFNQATTRINSLLAQNDAYLSTAHETRADGQHRQEMTIKVPPSKFVDLVTALSQLGHVENKDVASSDVTADVLQTAKTLLPSRRPPQSLSSS